MILFTIDVDWAPDELVDYTLGLFAENGINCTVFMTHVGSSDLGDSLFELGLHPNIRSLSEAEEKIATLKTSFPQAVGVRNHGVFSSFYLYEIYRKYDLTIESNYITFLSKYCTPSLIIHDIIQAPIFFMDDIFLRISGDFSLFSPCGEFAKLLVDDSFLFVFDFHPIHVYLNTDSIDRYEKAKKNYHDVRLLKNFRNNEYGVRTVLSDLFSLVKNNGLETYKISDVTRKMKVFF